jgi:hypothetical protein
MQVSVIFGDLELLNDELDMYVAWSASVEAQQKAVIVYLVCRYGLMITAP